LKQHSAYLASMRPSVLTLVPPKKKKKKKKEKMVTKSVWKYTFHRNENKDKPLV
jgi:hypothetical protein